MHRIAFLTFLFFNSVPKWCHFKCSMFFTYGARDLEWAHQVTFHLLSQANFRVVLSDEFIGSHSFNVAEGENMVVFGRSGTGKSVLLKHIIGLLSPDSGSILFDENMTKKELDDYKSRISY